MGRVRVLIADDHTMVVEAFRKLLEPGFEVVGVASASHLSRASRRRADVRPQPTEQVKTWLPQPGTTR